MSRCEEKRDREKPVVYRGADLGLVSVSSRAASGGGSGKRNCAGGRSGGEGRSDWTAARLLVAADARRAAVRCRRRHVSTRVRHLAVAVSRAIGTKTGRDAASCLTLRDSPHHHCRQCQRLLSNCRTSLCADGVVEEGRRTGREREWKASWRSQVVWRRCQEKNIIGNWLILIVIFSRAS